MGEGIQRGKSVCCGPSATPHKGGGGVGGFGLWGGFVCVVGVFCCCSKKKKKFWLLGGFVGGVLVFGGGGGVWCLGFGLF